MSAADLPSPRIRPPRRWLPSAIWIVPGLAALFGLSLVVHALNQRGPTITLRFATAQGIEAGKTKVKYKDVEIGDVTEVHLTEDRTRVQVTVELKKEAQGFAVEDSRFWVVRPRLAGSGVSGLETLLSGSYIGVDGGSSAKERSVFDGLDTPPVIASDVPGRRFVLVARDIGSLDVGSPVFFRRIPAGHIESYAMQPDGRIFLSAYIKAPYDRFVTDNSRFWHASGVDLRLDAGGLKLNTQSLAAMMLGGVAFETLGDMNAPEAETATRFTLAPDHDAALKAPDGESFPMVLRFHQSVRGLTIGAPVDFRGAELGQVRSIAMEYDATAGDFVPVITADIYPDRLGDMARRPDALTVSQRRQALADLVRRGLRAQLRTGSLVTGQLYVALDFFPSAPPARLDLKGEPPELPTVPGDFEELYKQAQSILRKLEKVPFDTIGQDLHKVLTTLDSTMKRVDAMAARTDQEIMPELRDSLKQMRASMETLNAALAGDAPLQQDTRQALKGLAEATRSLKRLTDSLDRQPESLLQGRKDQQ